MLIFFQVYRTIDKIYRSIQGSEWTKESKDINKMKLGSIQRKMLLKSSAPEDRVVLE